MAYIVMGYIFMAYIVMAYIVMATTPSLEATLQANEPYPETAASVVWADMYIGMGTHLCVGMSCRHGYGHVCLHA